MNAAEMNCAVPGCGCERSRFCSTHEPGPTLRALEELLSYAPADKVMFRRASGEPVTAAEMARMLRDADPDALDYLRNLHAAAVDVVGLRARGPR